MWNGCPREECKREWEEWSGGKTQKEHNEDYEQGSYGLRHCQYPGCHTLYWRGKNGCDCEVCGLKVCEGCQCDESRMVFMEDDDVYVCKGECENEFK